MEKKMLPGVGIFGSDPITKILIQILRHFEFDIHAIWTNHYEVESLTANSGGEQQTSDFESTTTPIKLVTTSIDHVLLNKNVNLVFVCCPPNLHAQIAIKALGIGKNVICIHPTCLNASDIEHMIGSAYYYPSLFSSCCFGGLKYLNEFRLIKQSMGLVGDVKLCNIVINCQNIALLRSVGGKQQRKKTTDSDAQQKSSLADGSNSSSSRQRQGSLSSLIDSIALIASSSTSSTSLNWLSDRDLGAGVLNRFGAAMISLCLNLFDNNKVTKCYGCLRTLIEDINLNPASASSASSSASTTTITKTDTHKRSGSLSSTTTTTTTTTTPIASTKSRMAPLSPHSNHQKTSQQQQQQQQRSRSSSIQNSIRKITADDYCTFQLRLEPSSILVNVTINSVANCRYSQEISICGNQGVLTWHNNSKLLFKRTQLNNNNNQSTSSLNSLDSNNNNNSAKLSDSVESLESFVLTETEIQSTEPIDQAAENFLSTYRNVERKHPELPLVFIRGLYYYLARVKQEFQARNSNKSTASTSATSTSSSSSSVSSPTKNTTTATATATLVENNKTTSSSFLENFEHMRIVQLIVKSIQQSSELNRWVTVCY